MKRTDDQANATANPIETELQTTTGLHMERNVATPVSPDMEFTSSPSFSGNAGNSAGLSPAVQKHIGNLLKASFQDLLTDPVPDRFSNLLEQLEQAESKKGK